MREYKKDTERKEVREERAGHSLVNDPIELLLFNVASLLPWSLFLF